MLDFRQAFGLVTLLGPLVLLVLTFDGMGCPQLGSVLMRTDVHIDTVLSTSFFPDRLGFYNVQFTVSNF